MFVKILGNVKHNSVDLTIGGIYEMSDSDGEALIKSKVAVASSLPGEKVPETKPERLIDKSKKALDKIATEMGIADPEKMTSKALVIQAIENHKREEKVEEIISNVEDQKNATQPIVEPTSLNGEEE